MSVRHHSNGTFATRGRQPRTEIEPPRRSKPKSNANARLNALLLQQNKAAAKATPGELVASGAIK